MPSVKAPRTDAEREFDNAVGKRLRTLRNLAGLNQTQLAKIAGITFQQIQKYELGVNRVAASRLKTLADALGVTPSRLLGEGDEISEAGDAGATELRRLIRQFSLCDEEGRAAILSLATALARPASA